MRYQLDTNGILIYISFMFCNLPDMGLSKNSGDGTPIEGHQLMEMMIDQLDLGVQHF